MKKNFLKLITIILILSSFVSCTNHDTSPTDSRDEIFFSEETNSSIDQEDNLNGENIAYKDLEKKDLKGRDIYITQSWFGYGKSTIDFTGEVLYMEEESGALTNVNQAKKDIIETVQKDYKCKINGEIFGEGSSNIVDDLKNKIINDLTSGTNKYDFFFESYYYYTGLISDKHLKRIGDIKTINTKSSCWDQNAVKELSICNDLYFLVGEINTYDNDGTIVMLFNKDLYSQMGYTHDLYQLVKDKKWTFDKFVSLCNEKKVTADIDGDTTELSEFDRWFLGSSTTNLYIHVVASGGSITTKDNKDIPKLSMKDENSIKALEAAVNFYNGGQVLIADQEKFYNKYPQAGGAFEYTVTNSFLEGRELFYMTSLIHVPYFRNMQDEFGILPVPMFSENQENYCSATSVHTSSALMIPNTVKADDDLGMIIQALAELSEEILTPEYYEKQLKFRDFKDVQSADMLDIVFQNRHYDLGAVFGSSWNSVDTLYAVMDTNIISRFDKVEGTVSSLINKTVEDINKAKS